MRPSHKILRAIPTILMSLAFLALAINAVRRPTTSDESDKLNDTVEYTLHRGELDRLLAAKAEAEKKRDDAIQRILDRSRLAGLDPTGPINEVRSIWAKPIAELDAAIKDETEILEKLNAPRPSKRTDPPTPR